MKALIHKKIKTFENGSGYPVFQVVDDNDIFDVHHELEWIDCLLQPEDSHKYHYNIDTKEFIENEPPLPEIPEGLTEADINDLI